MAKTAWADLGGHLSPDEADRYRHVIRWPFGIPPFTRLPLSAYIKIDCGDERKAEVQAAAEQLLADPDADIKSVVDRLLVQEVQRLVDAEAAEEERTILYGDGTGRPSGLLGSCATASIADEPGWSIERAFYETIDWKAYCQQGDQRMNDADDRRYKILTFPVRDFEDAVGHKGGAMPPIAGMPEGYEVTGVSEHVFFLQDKVAVRVHHPSFPEVSPAHTPTPVPGRFVEPPVDADVAEAVAEVPADSHPDPAPVPVAEVVPTEPAPAPPVDALAAALAAATAPATS